MGIGERRGGRRAGGRRRANHHRHNHHHHNRRRRRHHHGGRSGTSGPGGTTRTNVYTGKQALLIVIGMICIPGFLMGISMAGAGGFTSTTLGIIGMVFFLISFVSIVIVVVIWRHIKKKSPVRGVEAGNVHSNIAASTVALGGVSTTMPQVGETSYVIQTGAIQPAWPGGVAMGTQCYNQQTDYPGGATQPYPQPTPNYPVAAYPPPNPNGATEYPPPANPTAAHKPYPQTGAPPINYTTLHAAPPPSTDSHMGVDPASEENGVAPPPTYNDVMTGNVKYDEGGGLESGAI